jgi:hypothetical protein
MKACANNISNHESLKLIEEIEGLLGCPPPQASPQVKLPHLSNLLFG